MPHTSTSSILHLDAHAHPNQEVEPRPLPGMSPFMAAVVGYVLGESFTNPEIAELTVSETENFIYIRKSRLSVVSGNELN